MRINEEHVLKIKELENDFSKRMATNIESDCSFGKSSTGLDDKQEKVQPPLKSSTG